VNFSFVEAQWESDFCGNTEPIALENPIAAQLDVMRSSLMGSLVANLRFNLARKVDRVRVFEAARCFSRSSSDEDPREPARALAAVDVPQYREISKFPAVIRDRSMEFDEGIPVSGILEELTRNRPPLVQDIRLFDFYRGKGVERGKKSLAFRVVMQDTARTLTDAEADAAMAQLTELLAAKFGAKLRT